LPYKNTTFGFACIFMDTSNALAISLSPRTNHRGSAGVWADRDEGPEYPPQGALHVKVFISADIEGITGVSGAAQLRGPDYARMRRLMTQDVNAAVAGAYLGGAKEVVINDGHGDGTNILIEELDSRARLISGCNMPLSQMGGIDDTFSVVLFVGHHAMEGTHDGVVNHIYLGRTVNKLLLNGKPVGEMGANGAIAGHFGVPIGMESGDDKAVAEALALFPDIETVTTMIGMDRFVANSLTPAVTQKAIKEAAERAVRRAPDLKPFKVSLPATFEVEFKTTAETTYATLFPSVTRVGPKTVSVTAGNVVTAFKMLWGTFELGRAGAGA